MSITMVHQFLDCLHVLELWISSIPRHMRAVATHVKSAVTSVLHRHSAGSLPSSSDNSLPSAPLPGTVVTIPQGSQRDSEATFPALPVSQTAEPKSMQGPTSSFTLSSEKSSGMTGTSTVPSSSRRRFVQAVHNVIKMQQALAPFSRSISPTSLIPDGNHGMRGQATQPMPVQSARVAGLVPKLRGLVPTQVLEEHQALVRHVQFSPNGKFLATSRSVFLRLGRDKKHMGN